MSGNDIRNKFLTFMQEKGHAIIPSSALVPENDSTTLFTGSGMQPLIPYLLGESHPMGRRLADSQKCFRANDIEEVGDNRHTTFFEMLGNWSLGDYFKKDQLRWFFTFLVDEVGLNPEKIFVTVFAGDESLGIPKDTESVEIWKELFAERGIKAEDVHIGSEADGYELGMQNGRIFYYDSAKNWWSRSGRPENMPAGEIGGPDSEVFYDFGSEFATHPLFKDKKPHPNSDSGQFLEIGNSVFIEYIKQTDGTFKKLEQRNVDFGGGLERIASAKNNDPDMFKVDLLKNVILKIEETSGKKYEAELVAFRIITDHLRGAVFLIADGVLPGNSDQSYFVRRLLRRAVRYADKLQIKAGFFADLAESVITTYAIQYPSLLEKKDEIISTISKEEEQFRKTLESGLKQFNKITANAGSISADDLFELYTTYGFPIELTKEMAGEKSLSIDESGFLTLMEEHKNKSRSGSEQKFKGGLADNSEKTIQYHSANHLMLSGLRKVLGEHVHQAGSNITAERLRYDFSHGEKITNEELSAVENFVNTAIINGGEVTIETIPKSEAQKDKTIEASFWDRYPSEVKVYTMKNYEGEILSRELCGGPHVKNLEEIIGVFKIIKEESSASGVRRIKAILE